VQKSGALSWKVKTQEINALFALRMILYLRQFRNVRGNTQWWTQTRYLFYITYTFGFKNFVIIEETDIINGTNFANSYNFPNSSSDMRYQFNCLLYYLFYSNISNISCSINFYTFNVSLNSIKQTTNQLNKCIVRWDKRNYIFFKVFINIEHEMSSVSKLSQIIFGKWGKPFPNKFLLKFVFSFDNKFNV
jgi:hypothetical protein